MSHEVATQNQAPPSEGIQPGLDSRAKAMEAVAQARENLGQVAAGHEVHTDANGVVLTPREVAEHAAMGSHDDIRV